LDTAPAESFRRDARVIGALFVVAIGTVVQVRRAVTPQVT
jgi:hypothetical protein